VTAFVTSIPGHDRRASRIDEWRKYGRKTSGVGGQSADTNPVHECQLNADGTCSALTVNTACTPFTGRRYDESAGCYATVETTLWCCATAAGESCAWPPAIGCVQVAADGGTVDNGPRGCPVRGHSRQVKPAIKASLQEFHRRHPVSRLHQTQPLLMEPRWSARMARLIDWAATPALRPQKVPPARSPQRCVCPIRAVGSTGCAPMGDGPMGFPVPAPHLTGTASMSHHHPYCPESYRRNFRVNSRDWQRKSERHTQSW